MQTESVHESDVYWDFSNVHFLHPFFLLPLSLYKIRADVAVKCIFFPGSPIDRYLGYLCFQNPLRLRDLRDPSGFMSEYIGKSYTPICEFDVNSESELVQKHIENIIKKHWRYTSSLTMPLSYLISELVCNIGEHSRSNEGYIFAQYTPKDSCLNICIADKGISIYGSYIQTGKYLDIIGDNEAMAIKIATEGYSTKNLPGAENRGYGISTTKDMLVNGLGGAFFILSGNAFHRHQPGVFDYVNLPDSITWDGTIILLKIPLSVPSQFNYTNYIY